MAVLETIGLGGFHDRPAPLLSGGQQQRVALGRALVADPDVLLLDEPFSNLDARLREEMRFELKELQTRVGVTTLFVTHDQAEAMILSDRVARDERRADRPGRDAEADLRGAADALRHGLPGPGRSRRGPRGARARRRATSPCSTASTARGCPCPATASGGTEKPPSWPSARATSSSRRGPADGLWPGVVLAAVYLGERVEYVVQVGSGANPRLGPVGRSAWQGRSGRSRDPPERDSRLAGAPAVTRGARPLGARDETNGDKRRNRV